jgi:hypothetical protein
VKSVRVGVVAATIAWLLCGALVRAHEIGTTRVSALFQDARYEISIVTDAVALLEKLETLAGPYGRPSSIVEQSPAALGTRLGALDDVFRRRFTIAFDGAASRPAIDYAVAGPADALSPPLATIRLTGEIPAGARQFTWDYSWTFASYALSARNGVAPDAATEWLEGGQTSTPFALAAPPPPPGRAATAWRYLALGFTHIVPHGLDHMFFVLGIFLLNRRLRSVLAQVSAFTLAHSITLGLSIYGVIDVPALVVEPLIAASIAYVAIENLLLTDLRPWRIVLVFAFGLLHGMGFAGALRDVGLPRAEFLTALVTFNAGVEAGQLAVIAAAFALLGWRWGGRSWYRARVVVPASVIIACTALYWTIERVGL